MPKLSPEPILLIEVAEDPSSEKRVKGKTPAAERRLMQLEEFARYTNEAGGFVLTRQRSGRQRELGSKAGWVYYGRSVNYRNIQLNKVAYREHHLVWLWFTGDSIPTKLIIDHIDGNGENNRIDNLRAVTQSINRLNSRKREDNTSGESNVYRKSHGWVVQFQLDYKQHHFGTFPTLEEAVARRDEVLAMNLGHTSRHGK